MTGHIYRDVIVRLFRGAMSAEFLLMDDNARSHRANIVDECLQSEDITRMDWPAYSPDLNPIEHVWDILGQRIAARQPPPTYLPELQRVLLDEWCNIPQDQIDNLILNMPRRCCQTDRPKWSQISSNGDKSGDRASEGRVEMGWRQFDETLAVCENSFWEPCQHMWLKQVTNLPLVCHRAVHPYWREGECVVYDGSPYHHTSCGRGVQLQSEGGIKTFATGFPYTNTIVFPAQIESRFFAEGDLIHFGCVRIPSSAAPL
ncbi:transposable element Tc3 transposase [Trichonephila clavipes]|nr:transposable element Tc3 transposase [Trichonephila clavipes]